MDKKLSPYQKLKKQVHDLRQQLDIVCNEPDTRAGIEIKMVWKMNRMVERQIMAGNTTQLIENQ